MPKFSRGTTRWCLPPLCVIAFWSLQVEEAAYLARTTSTMISSAAESQPVDDKSNRGPVMQTEALAADVGSMHTRGAQQETDAPFDVASTSHHKHDPWTFYVLRMPLDLNEACLRSMRHKNWTDGLLPESALEIAIHATLLRSAQRVSNARNATFLYVPFYGACSKFDAGDGSAEHEKRVSRLGDFLAADAVFQSFNSTASAKRRVFVAVGSNWNVESMGASLLSGAIQLSYEVWPEAERSPSARVAPSPAQAARQRLRQRQTAAKAFRQAFRPRLPSAIALPYFADCGLSSLPSNEVASRARPVDVFFQGRVGRLGRGGALRKGLVQAFGAQAPAYVVSDSGEWKRNDRNAAVSAYRDGVLSSKFCLVPRGDTQTTAHLSNAVAAGCVPVILSDDWILPFRERLPWDDFSVRVPERWATGTLATGTGRGHAAGDPKTPATRLAALLEGLTQNATRVAAMQASLLRHRDCLTPGRGDPLPDVERFFSEAGPEAERPKTGRRWHPSACFERCLVAELQERARA
jgi:hypothetical protein